MLSSTHLMVVIIVAMALFAGVMRARYSAERHRPRPEQDAESLRMKEELKMLRDRIAVLERIATDKDHLLEQEIERLRDR